MRITRKLLLLLFIFLIIGCTGKRDVDVWLVVGENVEIRFFEHRIGFYENARLIFEAVTDKESVKKHIYRITQVGNNPVYQSRYLLNKLIRIQPGERENNTLKIYLGEPLKRYYTLVKSGNMKFQKEGWRSLDYQTDINDFLNDVKQHKQNLYAAHDLFFIEAVAENRQWDEAKVKEMLQNAAFKWIMEEPYRDNPERKPLRNINAMEDFMLDQNEKTAWIAGAEGSKHNIDFIFKTLKQGQRLQNNVVIKAIGFHPGFGQTPGEYVKYSRIKKIQIMFSRDYSGGIGSNQICYDYRNFSVALPDRQGLHVIYFNDPIPAKTVRIFIQDTHIGYDNIIGLNEVLFYVVENRNM